MGGSCKLRSWLVGGVVLCLSMAAGMRSGSALIVRSTLEKLSAKTDAVIYGVVTDQQVKQNSDGFPWTFSTLSVLDVFAGQVSAKTLTFRCAGGSMDGQSVSVSDVPQFHLGDEIVIFFREGGGACQVAGLYQGAFRVVKAIDGGRVVVNGEGRVVIGMTASDVLLGEEIVPQSVSTAVSQKNVDDADPDMVAVSSKPIDSKLVLDELKAFAQAFAYQAKEVSSTHGFVGASLFRQAPAPEPKDHGTTPEASQSKGNR